MQSREDEIAYCQAHGIHLPFSADTSYSRDRNIWAYQPRGLELEDPALSRTTITCWYSASPGKSP